MINPHKNIATANELVESKIIAICAGKGGVGKTHVAVNLSQALARSKTKTMLFDADLGLANVDIMLGLKPQQNIQDVIGGKCDLSEIILELPSGLRIVPGGSGVQELANLGQAERAGIIHAFSELKDDLDVFIIDTAAGISHEVIQFSQAAQDVMIVVCDEPSSITDAYAMIKVLNQKQTITKFKIIANMVRTKFEGKNLFNKLRGATNKFLDVSLEYLGDVPYDEFAIKAIKKQKAVVELYPSSKAAQAFFKLADTINNMKNSEPKTGRIEFFIERLICV